MKYLIVLLVLASLAVVGCSDSNSPEPVSAQSVDVPSSLSAQSGDLPLSLDKKGNRWKLTGVGIGTPPPAFVQCTGLPGFTAVGATGTGRSTGGIGRFTIIQGHCANFLTGESKNGKVVITAANGDKVYGTYRFQLLFPGTPPFFNFVGRAFLNGGSGKFRHIKAEGDVTGIVNASNGDYTLNIEGRLSHRDDD